MNQLSIHECEGCGRLVEIFRFEHTPHWSHRTTEDHYWCVDCWAEERAVRESEEIAEQERREFGGEVAR